MATARTKSRPDEAAGVVTLNSDAVKMVPTWMWTPMADPKTDSYLLSVSVTGANNVNLGEISVVIDIMGVNEAPAFDSTDDSARDIPENAQTGTDVGAVVKATGP